MQNQYDKAEINLKAEKEALKAKKDGLKETQTKNNISVKNQRLAIQSDGSNTQKA